MAAMLSYLLLAVGLTAGLVRAHDSDEAVLHAEMTRLNNQSLLWGPYRPNLYFGTRPRIPKSLMTGLMWARVDDYQSVQHSEPSVSRSLPLSVPC